MRMVRQRPGLSCFVGACAFSNSHSVELMAGSGCPRLGTGVRMASDSLAGLKLTYQNAQHRSLTEGIASVVPHFPC